MKTRIISVATILAAAAFALASGQACASTSVDFQIQFGGPSSSGTLEFHSQPEVVLVPATRVYYIRNYDCNMYRYGSYWYFVESNRWYRARDYRGPFVFIQSRSVPRSVVTVPINYRHNWHGPPPHAMARGHYKERGDNDHAEAHRHHKDKENDREAVAQGHYKEKGNGKD